MQQHCHTENDSHRYIYMLTYKKGDF